MRRSNPARRERAKYEIDLLIHGLIASCASDRPAQAAFLRLIVWARAHSDFTSVVDGARPGWADVRSVLFALLALCRHHRAWCRGVEEWQSPGGSLWTQFASLARHLLAKSPVPGFMTRVWFEQDEARAKAHQKLFKHLGCGGDIRGASLPVKLSREMARQFQRAPDDLSVEQAVRWGQVRGLGGAPAQARLLVNTQLGRTLENDAFWKEVIRLVLREWRWLQDELNLVVDFLAAQQQAKRIVTTTIKRLTVSGLLDAARLWRREGQGGRRFRRNSRLPVARSWHPLPIPGLLHHDESPKPWAVRYWTIRQLLNTAQLKEEGHALQHCVASYDWSCARRETSIWSLRQHGALSVEHLLTITVDPATRKIVYAKGRRNSPPTERARELLELWAEREELMIDPQVLSV